MERHAAQHVREVAIEADDAARERRRVVRVVLALVILGFVIAATTTALGVALVGLVLTGVGSGVGAAIVAGADDPRRRTFAVVLAGAGIVAVALGFWLGGLLAGLDPAGPDAGHLAMLSLVVSSIPIVLGSLLGYIIGRERRRARRS